MSEIPFEIKLKILLFLDLKSIINCSLLSKQWNKATRDSSIWSNLGLSYFGIKTLRFAFVQEFKLLNSFKTKRYSTHYQLLSDWVLALKCTTMNQVCCGTRNGYLTIFDSELQNIIASFKAHRMGLCCIESYKDLLITGGWDGLVKLWNIDPIITNDIKQQSLDPMMANNIKHNPIMLNNHLAVISLKVCLDLNILVCGMEPGDLRVWSLESFHQLQYLDMGGELITCIEYSLGKLYYCKGGKIEILRFNHNLGLFEHELTVDICSSSITCMYINLKQYANQKISTYDNDGCTNDNQKPSTNEKPSTNDKVCTIHTNKYRNNAQILIGAEDGNLYVYDINFKRQHTLKAHYDGIRCLSVLDNYLVTGSFDNSLIIWSLKSFEPICTLNEHKGDINAVQFSGRGVIVSGSDDKSIILSKFDIQ